MRILGIDPLVGGAPQANLLALAIIKDKPFSEVSRPRFATFAKDFSKPGNGNGDGDALESSGAPARASVQLPD